MSNRLKQSPSNEHDVESRIQPSVGTVEPYAIDLQAIDQVPSDPQDYVTYIFATGQQFLLEFEYGLSGHDLALWRKHGLKTPEEIDGRRLANQLDEYILNQVCVLGYRVFLNSAVINRISQWRGEKNGPELSERLGRNLAINLRVTRGEASLPLTDPLFHEFKQETLAEIRTLQNLARVIVKSRHRQPNSLEILSLIKDKVVSPEQPFPRLFKNWTSFHSYSMKFPEEVNGLVVTGDVTPAEFINRWIGWATGRASESVRKKISALGNRNIGR